MTIQRTANRKPTELRPIEILRGVNPYAEGSAEVKFGGTRVLCTASVERDVPRWMKPAPGAQQTPTILSGWITAEYGMLPRSTHTRNQREAATGKQGGRTQEIQRLIGRALRRAVSLEAIPGLTIRIDCDVIVADGGTRTAAISGSWVALHAALRTCVERGFLPTFPPLRQIAAVSVGVVSGVDVLDLAYEEDSAADFDLNLVANDALELIEFQGTGEKGELSLPRINQLVELGLKGIKEILEIQRKSCGL